MTYNHNITVNGPAGPPIGISEAVSERAMLHELLSPADIDLMARYAASGFTQRQIGQQDGVDRRTIGYRVKKIARRLEAAGIPIKLPKRGRRPLVRDHAVDPLAIGCLIDTGRSEGDGRAKMKWAKAKKIDDDQDAREW